MANMLFANNCNTTLNGGITAVATSMVVTSATGFPSPTGSQYFYCTLADAATQTTIEIVKVTAVSGTTFTIVRGQDGTTGTIFASGAVVSLRLVRASLNDFPKLDEANTFTQAQTFSALTVGRIPFSGTGGVQTDSANLYWDNTNANLGIGSASPSVKLYVRANLTAGTSNSIRLLDDGAAATSTSNNSYGYGFNASTGELSSTAGNGGFHSWYTANTEKMRIFNSGGVSVGNTTDPGAGNLSVTGNITTASYLSATGTLGANKTSAGVMDFSAGSTRFFSYGAASTNGIYVWYSGQGGASPSEYMRMDGSGNLLLGTATATAKFVVKSSAQNFGGGIALVDSGSTNNWQFVYGSNTYLYVGFNSAALGYFNSATGVYVPVSDKRLKKNIENSSYGLKEVLSLRPVLYNMKTESDSSKKHIGFIAQEIKAIIDESVDDIDEEKEFYGLDKSALVPVLVKAIQELNSKFEAYVASHP